ncbi:zf-HC2 domain-containing protein [Geodermatophilus sp. SYSU D00705]
MTCRAVVPDLGALLLGAFEPADRRRVEAHLDDCADCRAELAELAALPELLALVDPADLEAPHVTPSPDLFARVSAAARRPSRARRLLLVAAALVLVAGGAAAGMAAWSGSGATTAVASEGAVRMAVTASTGGGGTVVDVAVAGLPQEAWCRLVVVDRDGRHHAAGEWAVDYEGGGIWRGWADVDAGAVTAVLVVDEDGAALVRAPL